MGTPVKKSNISIPARRNEIDLATTNQRIIEVESHKIDREKRQQRYCISKINAVKNTIFSVC